MDHQGSKQLSALGAFMQSAGAKLLILGLNAATGILTARALAPAGRGELSAMMLWYIFLANVFSLGIPSALTYRLRRHPEKVSELSGAALLFTLGIGIVAGAVGFIGLPHWIPQYSPQVLFFARIFLLNTPVAVFVVIGRAALESQGNFTASNLSLIGPASLTLAGLLLLRWAHAFTPVNAAWCYVLSGLPPTVWMGLTFYRAVRPRFQDLQKSVRLLLSYGIRSYGIDLCGGGPYPAAQFDGHLRCGPESVPHAERVPYRGGDGALSSSCVQARTRGFGYDRPSGANDHLGHHCLWCRHNDRRAASAGSSLRRRVSGSYRYSAHSGGRGGYWWSDSGDGTGIYGTLPARCDYHT
jgi:hypothetical protein